MDYSKGIEGKLEEIMEIKEEENFIIILKKLLRYIKIKIIILSIFQTILILFCNYYLLIFFIIFSCSQISLLINYLVSFFEKIIFSILISIIITINRKIGIFYNNKYSFNTSNYIKEHF